MQYWLFKTEPSSWSWDEQVAAGAKGTFWSGVRNHTAKQNLQRMKARRPRLLLPFRRR